MRRPLRTLAGLRGLRGTMFDPFGWTEERRMERALIDWYEGLIDRCAQELGAGSVETWTEILRAPEAIRGFGPVKAANAERVRASVDALFATL